MRFRFLVLTAALFLTPQIGFPQSGTSANCDGTSCKATFTFGPYGMGPVTNAAYSGQQTTTNVQTLADGTHIVRPSQLSITTWRDSQGRVRTERPLFPGMAASQSPVSFVQTEIQDPLAGYVYVLDSVNQVAHRVAVQSRPNPVLPPGAGGPNPTAIDLGTQVMFGVTLTGRQTTSVTPAGSPMGNDQPITMVTQTWTDPRTNVVVLRKSTSPTGNSTMTLQSYTDAEPAPALFQVPAGYRIVDETGSFTLLIARAN